MQAGLWAMHLNGGAFTVAEFARTVALGARGGRRGVLGTRRARGLVREAEAVLTVVRWGFSAGG